MLNLVRSVRCFPFLPLVSTPSITAYASSNSSSNIFPAISSRLRCCHEIINIRDVITFQGSGVEELKQAFQDSIDDYLEFCKQRGEEPDKPFLEKLTLNYTK